MKTILAAATLIALSTVSASAADLATRPYTKAPAMVAPSWNWSGFYIGGNVGWGISHSAADTAVTIPTVPPVIAFAGSDDLSSDGVVGGGQIGWNTMIAPMWLVGIEADFQGADQRGGNTLSGVGLGGRDSFVDVESRLNWFGTVRGRLGWTVNPETLVYVTGGYAYGEVEIRNSSNIERGFGVPVMAAASVKGVKDGWTVGGGVETRLWNSNWTAKAEYLYMNLGSQSIANDMGFFGDIQASHVDFKDHIVRVGLNYKLGNWAY